MEIGSTLRETRIRAGISVEEIEARTKIRAKYLRALENEEWGLVPGPAYVSSFLRSYADSLGLDGRLLVDEYRRRFEQPSESELAQYTEPVLSRRPRRRPPTPRPPGWLIGAGVVLILILALGVLGSLGDSDDESPTVAAETTGTTPTSTVPTETTSRRKRKPPAPRLARLTVGAQGPVWTCIVDATGRERVKARVLQPGDSVGPFRSKRFRVTLGNGAATMRVNGKRLGVPEVSEPIGYSVSRKGRRPLSKSRRPTCA